MKQLDRALSAQFYSSPQTKLSSHHRSLPPCTQVHSSFYRTWVCLWVFRAWVAAEHCETWHFEMLWVVFSFNLRNLKKWIWSKASYCSRIASKCLSFAIACKGNKSITSQTSIGSWWNDSNRLNLYTINRSWEDLCVIRYRSGTWIMMTRWDLRSIVWVCLLTRQTKIIKSHVFWGR